MDLADRFVAHQPDLGARFSHLQASEGISR